MESSTEIIYDLKQGQPIPKDLWWRNPKLRSSDEHIRETYAEIGATVFVEFTDLDGNRKTVKVDNRLEN